MKSRVLLSAAFAAACVVPSVFFFAGCGSDSTTNGNNATDASTDQSTTDSAPASDGGGGTDGGGLPEGSVAPQGTHLATLSAFSLDGLTSDGYAIYRDNAAGTLFAVSVSGGTPVTLGPVDDQNAVFVDGKVVFFMATVDQNTGLGPMSVWTSAGGAHALATSALAFGGFAKASADGSHVVYVDGVDSNVKGGDVYVAASDASGKSKVVTAASFTNSCFPEIGFAGALAATSYCVAPVVTDGGAGDAGTDAGIDASTPDAGGDAGAPSTAIATLKTFVAATGAPALSVDGIVPGWLADTAGTNVLVSSSAGLTIYAADGTGGPTVLDADGKRGRFTPDGNSVLYVTSASALKRTTVATPAPTTLLASDVTAILAISPDGKSVLTFKTQDPQTRNSDLFVASATAAGTATQLASADGGANLYGDPFTSDSSHVLFYTNIDPQAGTGDFNAVTLAGSGAALLGSNVWVNMSLNGTKVAFDDNDTNGSSGDLEVVDVASSAKPTLLVSQVDQDFYVTTGKDKIVYGWSLVAGPMSGIWVMDAP